MPQAKNMQEMTTAGRANIAGERRRQGRRGLEVDGVSAGGESEDIGAARHREIMSALRELTAQLAQTVAPRADPTSPLPRSLTMSAPAGTPSAAMNMLAAAVADGDDGGPWRAAAFVAGEAVRVSKNSLAREIDAIIAAAETATEAVIANAELIDDLIGRFGKRIGFIDNDASLDDAGVCLVRIFEACSRQDVACQHLRRLLDEITAKDG